MKRYLLAVMAVGAFALPLRESSAQVSSANQVLFGITYIQNQLITIDTTTGEGTLVNTIDADESGYGLTTYNGELYTFNPHTNTIDQISRIDAKVLSSKSIGVTNLAGEGDLVMNSAGVGFLSSAFDSTGAYTHPLYRFDLTAGTSVLLTNTSVVLDGLALDNKTPSNLYGLGQGDSGNADPSTVDTYLYKIDQTTGALTTVGAIGVPHNSPVAGMTFSSDGTLYAAIDDQLYTINTSTGAATVADSSTPDLSFSSVSGLAFASGTSLLANLSSRADVLTGDDVFIQGVIVTAADSNSPPPATATKEIIFRALGPSLSINGVLLSGTLANPTLSLYDSSGKVIATNDDWKQNSAMDQTIITDSGLAPANDSESVIVANLTQGEYTAIVSGVNGGTGIALAEIYDISEDDGLKAGNMSARALVAPGDDALISGMIVQGSLDKRVLVRGLGPSLSGEVPTPLADPLLMAYDANGTLVETNDSWMDSPEVADIEASGLAPSNPLEAVIDRIFTPGAYTIVLTGVGDTTAATGTALIEAYDRD